MCISHEFNHVGKHLQFNELAEIFTLYPHRGAQALQFGVAPNFEKLVPFSNKLDAQPRDDATRKMLTDIFNSPEKSLPHFCPCNSLQRGILPLRTTTYELEGDWLEIFWFTIVWSDCVDLAKKYSRVASETFPT